MAKILVIDDDVDYLKSLKFILEINGYQVVTTTSGKDGLKKAFNYMPDLIILDLVMPQMDGVQTCRSFRALTATPIIILTARADETSLIQGLDAGADDFLVKPCSQNILIAKIAAILRRAKTNSPIKAKYSDGYLEMELTREKVIVDGQEAKLTSTEFRLLAYLFRNADRVVPHEELIQEIWGEHSTTDKRSLKLYILYLRRKIERDPDNPAYLKTAWGVGYRFYLPEYYQVNGHPKSLKPDEN
jgi:DNA-binding response OmpR family regulator